MRKDGMETRRRILSVCVRLILEQGFRRTTVSQITAEAGISRGSYLNQFATKEEILRELVEAMFQGQFAMARNLTEGNLSGVYTYALETAIQLTLTECNENIREIYLDAYASPSISEYIYQKTARELKRIFGSHFADASDRLFYELEIGTSGLMRNYMARKCDADFPPERKINAFLTAALRVFRIPEEEIAGILAELIKLDLRAIATETLKNLFAMLEMKYHFKLPEGVENPLKP